MSEFPTPKRSRNRPADTEWVALRTLILATLQPYPDAYAALLAALREKYV